ncbi:hypothetical protein M0R45_011801 [Rubus argutus]|uniref:Branched-chain-amino-acid aminotransferase n=1 Tax=Rubus argutus TaxID=59490 RepID=A0AAW1YBU4_RUBAR
MCMPAPTVHQQFVKAVKLSVLANRRWVPLPNKGFLHIKPLLMGNGPVLCVKPAPEFTFLIYATSMGNHFKDIIGRHLIQLYHIFHFSDGNRRGRLEPINLVVENETHGAVRETSTSNIFIVKDKIISTPALEGTILPGVTRKSIIEIARSQGYRAWNRRFNIQLVWCLSNCTYLALSNIQMGLAQDNRGWTVTLK